MEMLSNPIVSQIVSICVAGFCGYLASQMRNLSAREKALHEGMKTLLRRELIEAYERYVTANEPLSLMRREEIGRCYRAYKELGGNGTGEQLFQEIAKVQVYVMNRRGDE